MEVPEEWVISRVCEEFSCLPLEAIEALEHDYNRLIFRIMKLRSYAGAKREYEAGQKETDTERRPQGPHIEEVREIEFEFIKARIKATEEKAKENP